MRTRSMLCSSLLVMLAGLCVVTAALADGVKLRGSGASFPFPLYGLWFKEYGKIHKDVIIDYQAKGSGAGIKDFMNKTPHPPHSQTTKKKKNTKKKNDKKTI